MWCRHLASAGCDCKVLVWDLNRRCVAAASGEDGHTDSIYCLAANEAGSSIASGSVDCDVRVWDPRSGESKIRLRGHTNVVRSLIFSSDGQHLFTCASDRTVRMWHIGEQRCEAEWSPHEDSIFSLVSLSLLLLLLLEDLALCKGEFCGDISDEAVWYSISPS